jgi:uncharacterized integral membrane protein
VWRTHWRYGLAMSDTDFASLAEGSRDNNGADPAEEDASAPRRKSDPDPLRSSRTSGSWVAVLVLALLLLLLAVFIMQNTQKVEFSFGWNGHAPLAATLLIATVACARDCRQERTWLSS